MMSQNNTIERSETSKTHHKQVHGYVIRVSLITIILKFVINFIISIIDSYEGSFERRLLKDLLANYQVLERPVANESEPLLVSFGLTLQQIIDVDEKNQILTSNVWLNLDEKNQQLVTNTWLKLEWVDTNMRWNASEYGGIQDLRITPGKIWKPDILMYNSADEKFDGTFQTNVVVKNNGSCTYIPPGIFKSTCKIDITWFPFDDQKCDMKFGSWTYDGFALDLRLPEEEGDISSYIPNGEWVLMAVPGVRTVQYYQCCPEPYVDITFTIMIRRRTLYYGFNLIIPSVIISSMTLLSFTLPPDSGEKLTLGVTILLSMIVFLMQLAEIMPATSDSVSIVGSYFACIMIMVAFSVVMTVIVLNFHHRTTVHHDMPQWIRTIILTWLPWLLRIERPGKLKPPHTRHSHQNISSKTGISGISNISNKLKELEQLQASESRDAEVEFIQLHSTNRCTQGCHCYNNINSYAQNLYNIHNMDENDMISYNAAFSDVSAPTCPHLINCIKELNPILRELKFITNRMRREDELTEIISEWKFAATVIDRLCLILFTAFAVISTAVCLLSAPHLIA